MSKQPDNYANEDATQELLRISKWPDPLRLAYLLEKEMLWPLHGKAADELRRLHEIEEAAKNLVKVKGRFHTMQAFNKLRELLK